jgi:hypothetical protein
MRHIITAVLLLAAWCIPSAQASPDYRQQVPEALQPWVDWVLWPHQDLACPVAVDSAMPLCLWPGPLQLQLDASGGRFAQHLTLYTENLVPLPGDAGQWPVEVLVDGAPAAVIAHEARPAVRLMPGSHDIEGGFAWRALPESLLLPAATGMVELELEGSNVSHPLIKGGRVWLGATTQQQASKRPLDELSLEVTRKLGDGHPLEMTTRMMLQVSGQQREEVLGAPLLQGFIPLQLRSDLPARLDADGKLRVQVKPGQWLLEVEGYHPGYLEQLELPAQEAPWPQDEVWAFQAQPEVRLVEIANGIQVDPRQTRLPQEWQQLPAYLMKSGAALLIKVIRRGDPVPDPDSLQLTRTLWLDFSGRGFTLRDRLQGKMTAGWRLSVDEDMQLGRVTLNGEAQFITSMGDGRSGVEVRRGAIDLQAESRLESSADVPVTGWGRDLQKVAAELNLPPGWRLLAASGVDVEQDSWLKQWSLYDLFVVFIVAFGAGRLWGWRWAGVTLITLALIWHEPLAPRGIWFYLLVVAALQRVISSGKIMQLLRIAWIGGLTALVLLLLPFAVDQARTALYPQLESAAMHRPPPTPRKLQPPQSMEVAKEVQGKARDAVGGLASSLSRHDAPAPPPERKMWLPDSGAQVQTGPGLPDWQWRRIALRWDGPVSATQRMRLLLTGPQINMALNFLRILLVALLAWLFIDWRRQRQRHAVSAANAASVAGMMVTAAVIAGMPDAMAADFPPGEVLQELEQRLLKVPQCSPGCADISRMHLHVRGDEFTLRMRVSAAAFSAAPVPMGSLVPADAWIDDQPAALLSAAGERWMEVAPGQHDLRISGRMPAEAQLSLNLPLLPRRLEVDVSGWTVEGVDPNGVPGSQLLLTRVAGERPQDGSDKLSPSLLPPFVLIERTLRLGLDWSVENRAIRLSPAGTPASLQVPLLPGEAVVTEGFAVKDKRVLVNLAAGDTSTTWSSRLQQAAELTLTAAAANGWIERWKLDISPIWHVETRGIAPAHHQQQGNWLPEYLPWPGDSVTLQVSRPQGVPGAVMTVAASEMAVSPGKRATDTRLGIKVRASQGGSYEINLPPQALLQSVSIDGRSQPIRQEGRRLSLPLHPGEQQFQLHWREAKGIGSYWRSALIDLGRPSVNARVAVKLAGDRWTLFTLGPRLGPAVLFWGELIVLIIVAAGLGRLKGWTPLGGWSWFLLGIGLTQVTPLSALLVVGAMLALGYRKRLDTVRIDSFNIMQVLLALLVIAGAVSLLWAVQQGLLGVPRMQIAGNGSNAYELKWYQDRAAGELPQVTVISLPLAIYRWLMLAWALWLALSVLKWSQWAWEAFTHGERWRPVKLKLPKLNSAPREKSAKANE